MHNSDLNPEVLSGLSWYYLLAAMLNAAAAAYVGYMEMVSEGGSRDGLAKRTRKLPEWLLFSFFGLYGVATLMIMGRSSLPGAMTVGYTLLRPRQLHRGHLRRGRCRALLGSEIRWARTRV